MDIFSTYGTTPYRVIKNKANNVKQKICKGHSSVKSTKFFIVSQFLRCSKRTTQKGDKVNYPKVKNRSSEKRPVVHIHNSCCVLKAQNMVLELVPSFILTRDQNQPSTRRDINKAFQFNRLNLLQAIYHMTKLVTDKSLKYPCH